MAYFEEKKLAFRRNFSYFFYTKIWNAQNLDWKNDKKLIKSSVFPYPYPKYAWTICSLKITDIMSSPFREEDGSYKPIFLWLERERVA